MMFKHRVQYRNEFSHTSCQSHLFTFSGSTKTIVKSADNRIKPCGNQSGHIKHRSHSTSSSPDTSSPMISATVPVKGCYPDKSRYLPPIQRSYFGKRAYNGRGEGRTNSRHTLKKTVFLQSGSFFINCMMFRSVSANSFCNQTIWAFILCFTSFGIPRRRLFSAVIISMI